MKSKFKWTQAFHGHSAQLKNMQLGNINGSETVFQHEAYQLLHTWKEPKTMLGKIG